MINLQCKRVQCDEIWSFVGAKQKNVAHGAAGYGIADHVWSLDEIAALVPEPVANKRSPYKGRNVS